MEKLQELPNISKVIGSKLVEVGIDTPALLKSIGSKEAFRRIKSKDSTACINMLYALEGAIAGIRWHFLPDEIKKELKQFYNAL